MLDCKQAKNNYTNGLFLLLKIFNFGHFELYKNTHSSLGVLCKIFPLVKDKIFNNMIKCPKVIFSVDLTENDFTIQVCSLTTIYTTESLLCRACFNDGSTLLWKN